MALEMNIIHTLCCHAGGLVLLRGPFSNLCTRSLAAFCIKLRRMHRHMISLCCICDFYYNIDGFSLKPPSVAIFSVPTCRSHIVPANIA